MALQAWLMKIALCLVALVVPVLLLTVGPGLQTAPPPAGAWPAARIGYGTIDNTSNSDRIKDLGFNWAKYLVYWKDAQPNQGDTPNYARYDGLVDTARQKGLHVLLRVDEPPVWAMGRTARNSPPQNDAAFGDFLYGLAAYFKGRVEAYEIWNEPNIAWE